MLTYDIEIYGNWLEDGVNADIKYPCGEIVKSWRVHTCVEAAKKVNDWIAQNPSKTHQLCKSEYCRG